AKNEFIRMNRKWKPKHWMVDAGFGHCLDLNTKILTKNGITLLKNINIGDLVLTHDGTYQKVLNKFKPSIQKKVLKITPQCHEPINTSEDHKFLIKRLEKRFKATNDEILKDPEYIKAGNIDKKTDFLAIPKRKYKNIESKTLDLYEFLINEIPNLKSDNTYIWIENSYSKLKAFSLKDIAKKCSASVATITRIRRKYFNKIYNYTKFEEEIVKNFENILFQESPIIKIHRYINILDERFLKFIGLFIAEGNLSSNGIELTQYESNLEKSDFINIINDFAKIMNLEYSIYKTRINKNNLGIVKKTNNEFKFRGFLFGTIINKLILKLTGKISDKKVINSELMKYANKLMPLLDGLYLGDGHSYKHEGGNEHLSLTTTSENIAYQSREILLANKILSSVKSYKKGQYKKQFRVNYVKKYNKNSLRNYLESKDYFYVPIRNIEFKEYTDNLLDITVEVNNSFVANGVICHNSTYEELKLYSVRVEQDRACVPSHPDAMIKHILEPVNFGGWTEIEDPFTKEIVKKTTKSFIVSQISRLFEPNDGKVPVSISASDHELIKCLENYKLINITSKGVEQYGFDKKGDIEDHPIDSWGLAIYGIVKYYNDLFKRIVAMSVSIDAKSILAPKTDIDNSIYIDHSQSIVLLTDNSPEPIYLDEKSLRKYEPKDENLLPVITRTFNKNMQKPRNNVFKRNRHIISRTNF
ncbi:MAG: LAGLIDADG family homing endonuclease, partial [Tenuifilaceae bacterium]|nr:LAGLIDADG family homing endonuclease [Tenuifilaceae bacterium]